MILTILTGHNRLGGIEMDLKIFDFLLAKVALIINNKDIADAASTDTLVMRQRAELLAEIKRAKEMLSVEQEVWFLGFIISHTSIRSKL